MNLETVDDKYKCPFCGMLFGKYGIKSHIYRRHTEKGKNHPVFKDAFKNYYKDHRSWRLGLSSSTNENIKTSGEKISETSRRKTQNGENNFQIYMKNFPEQHRLSASKGGGLRKMSGKGHKGWYKGYYCQSSWELAFVIYCLDKEIKIERNKEGFEYIFEEVKHKYYPDFIVNEEYIEIKGYKDKKCEEKIKQFTKTLKVLEKDEMKVYLDYVIEKYGENFISLYNIGDSSKGEDATLIKLT